MMDILKSVDRFLGQAMRLFCIANLIALMAALSAVVFIRFFPVAQLSWSDEIIEWLMASLIFIAAAALWRESDHFRIEALAERLAGTKFGIIFTFAIEICTTVFIFFFAKYSLDLTIAVGRTSPILAWPMTWWYAPMPVAGFIMVAYSVRNIVQGFQAIVGAFGGGGSGGAKSTTNTN
ncbi:MAG: TRAP transporter small permease subunit [Rhodospirillales bacterium]|nr:TRAP transporter small permease subunit [Rhodospirillales bacterium]